MITITDDGGERGSGQPAPHETQQGASTPGHRLGEAAGNVADSHSTPIGHRGAGPSSSDFLGPANDTPEVLIEIAAAELADFPDASWVGDPEWESCSYGVLCFHNGGTPGCDEDGGCSLYADAEWVGWLAAAILEHEQYDMTTAEARRRPRSTMERLVDEACGVPK